MAPPRRDAGQKASLRKAQKRLKEAKASTKKATPRPASRAKRDAKKWLACAKCGLTDETVARSPVDEKPHCPKPDCAPPAARAETLANAAAKQEGRDVCADCLDPDGGLDPDRGVGEPIMSDDVSVEPIEKTGAKLSFGFYALTLTDDQADEIRGLDPVTRAIEVATKMRARKDGSGRAPNGADWDRALEKLTDKITGGW